MRSLSAQRYQWTLMILLALLLFITAFLPLAVYAEPDLEITTENFTFTIHPNNGRGDAPVTVEAEMTISKQKEADQSVVITFTASVPFSGTSYNALKPTDLSGLQNGKIINPNKTLAFDGANYDINNGCLTLQGHGKLSENGDPVSGLPLCGNLEETKQLDIMLFWDFKSAETEHQEHSHCFLTTTKDPILTYAKYDQNKDTYQLKELPELRFYATDGGSLSFLYHGEDAERTADGDFFRVVAVYTAWPQCTTWLDVIYDMEQSKKLWPGQPAYIMPEPIPDEGYGFDRWEPEWYVDFLNDGYNGYYKIINTPGKLDQYMDLINKPQPGQIEAPGNGIKITSPFAHPFYYGSSTFTSFFNKIELPPTEPTDPIIIKIPCPTQPSSYPTQTEVVSGPSTVTTAPIEALPRTGAVAPTTGTDRSAHRAGSAD